MSRNLLATALASMQSDLAAGGAVALLKNRAFLACGGSAAAVLIGAGAIGGGAPTELAVKGLYLGMPIEEAAQVMLAHGLPPGGDAEWDLTVLTPGVDAARNEYEAAEMEHTIECVQAYLDEHPGASLHDYLKTVLPADLLNPRRSTAR